MTDSPDQDDFITQFGDPDLIHGYTEGSEAPSENAFLQITIAPIMSPHLRRRLARLRLVRRRGRDR